MASSFTLGQDYFCDPGLFDLETDRVFRRWWLAVGRCSELRNRGDYRTFNLEGHDLILLHGGDRVRCFHNTCRHRGARVLDEPEGALGPGCIVCPYHSWRYHGDGSLASAPNMSEAEAFDRESYGLRELPCQSWLGFWMVSLDPQHTQLNASYRQVAQQFAPWQLDKLQPAGRIEYDVAANWKLIMQNYSECYHCPTVHPALHRLTHYKTATNDLVSGPFLGGPMQLQNECETISADAKRLGSPIHSLDQVQRRQVYYYVLFPNLLLSLHPDYVMAHRLQRVAVDRTRICCDFHFPAETVSQPTFSPRRAIDFWDEVNRQDWRVCELSQRGIASPGYQPGPYSPLERMLVAFDQHYLQVMAQTDSGLAG